MMHNYYLIHQLFIFLPKGILVTTEKLTSETDLDHYVKNYGRVRRVQVYMVLHSFDLEF